MGKKTKILVQEPTKITKEVENIIKDKPLKQTPKISFDSWHFMRSGKIPAKHVKEILVVDFRAQGLSNLEMIETFDNALKTYGVDI